MSERPSGTICTPDELAVSANSTTLRCFTRKESLGLELTTIASFMSLVAVCYVFFLILWNIGRLYLGFKRRRKGLRLFHKPMDVLMLSLFVADTLQAIGGAIDARWVIDGKVKVGTLCNAQGIIQNVGETAVAISNLTISIYTFLGLCRKKDISSIRFTVGVIACIWLFIAIIVTVSNTTNHSPPFMSPTPYWCWIGQDYMTWRIFAEYLWLWMALFVSLCVYVPLLWIIQDVNSWCNALIFLAYPLTYCISVLPLSVIRWNGFVQQAKTNTPIAATFATDSLFALGGFFNVILLLKTRPDVGLFGNFVSQGLPDDEPTSSEPQVDGNQENVQAGSEKESLSDAGALPV